MSRRHATYLSTAAALLTALNAGALGPHEVLLLVNTNSRCSVDVAAEYARLRGIPGINIVRLGIPEGEAGTPIAVSSDDFTKLIWLPANAAIRERGIGDHVLAWIYAPDFPTKITTHPQMSLAGLTFIRNQRVDATMAGHGTWRSPLFTGPANPKAGVSPSQSFDVSRGWLGDDMPLPSMMLGFAGERGNSKEDILKCLESGAKSDRTRPPGTVYFLTGEDIRAGARAWQFPAAQLRLSEMGVAAVITNSVPPGRTNVLGMLVGRADVVPRQFGQFLPGSMADHLTSSAADFQNAGQTKLTAWIEAGVAVSSGTVTEPMALWTKFPNAWTYVHYASGCTAIESLYQGVSCPLQILFVGEPLACPWAPDASLSLGGLEDAAAARTISVRANVTSRADRLFVRYMFLLDGRTIPGAPGVKAVQAGSGSSIELDTTTISNGTHTLRAVAYSTGSVRGQVFAEKAFTVKNGE